MWIQGLSSLGQLPLPSEKSQKISHSYQVMVSTQTSLTCSRNDDLLPQSLLYNIISSKLAEAFTLTSLHAKLNDYQDNLAFLKREPNQPSYQFTCNFPNKPHLDLFLPSDLKQKGSKYQGWISKNTYLQRKRGRLPSSFMIRCPNCRVTFKSQRSLKYHMQRCGNMVFNKPLTTVCKKQSLESETPSFPAEVQSAVVSANAIKETVGLSKCPLENKSDQDLIHQNAQRQNMVQTRSSASSGRPDNTKLTAHGTVKSPQKDLISNSVNASSHQVPDHENIRFVSEEERGTGGCRVRKLPDHENIRFVSEEERGTGGSSEQVMVAYLINSGDSTVPDNAVEKTCGKSTRIESSNEPQKKRKALVLNNVNGDVPSEADIFDPINNSAKQKEQQHDNINTSSIEASSKLPENGIGYPEVMEFEVLPKFASMVSNEPLPEVGSQLLNEPDVPEFAADAAMAMGITCKREFQLSAPSSPSIETCQDMDFNKPSGFQDCKQESLRSLYTKLPCEMCCKNYQVDVQASMKNSARKCSYEDEVPEPGEDSITSCFKQEQESSESGCDNVSVKSCLVENSKSILLKTNHSTACTTKTLVQTKDLESDSYNASCKNPIDEMNNLKTMVQPSKEKAADQSSSMQDEHKRTTNGTETDSQMITNPIDQHEGMKRAVSQKRKRFKCFQCPYATNRKFDLARHQRAHKGKKPLKCSQCSSVSTIRWNLWQKLDRLETAVLEQTRARENMTTKLAAVETQISKIMCEEATPITDPRCQNRVPELAEESPEVGSSADTKSKLQRRTMYPKYSADRASQGTIDELLGNEALSQVKSSLEFLKAAMKDRFPTSYFLDRVLWMDPAKIPVTSGVPVTARRPRLLFDPVYTDSLIRVTARMYKKTEGDVRYTLKNIISNTKKKLRKQEHTRQLQQTAPTTATEGTKWGLSAECV